MNFKLLIGLLLALPILSFATLIDEKGRDAKPSKNIWNAPKVEDGGLWTNWKDCVASCKAKGAGWTTYDNWFETFIAPPIADEDRCLCKIDLMN